jgi:anaerobic selenocysteine-containing dehydrogenase
LRRVGPKGSRRFERIVWEDAIAETTARWRDIIADGFASLNRAEHLVPL